MFIALNRKSLVALAIASAAGVGTTNNFSRGATIIDWSGGTSTDWTVVTNWNSGNGPVPTNDLTTNIVGFNQSSYANQPTIGVTFIVSGVGGHHYGVEVNGISDSGSGDVTISNNGTVPSGGVSPNLLGLGSGGISMASTSGNLTISAPVLVLADCTFANASSSTLFLDSTSNVGGFNDNSYGAKAINVNVTGAGAVAVGNVWSNSNGLTNQLGVFGTWGTGANTRYLTVTTTVNSGGSGTDHNLGGYIGGTSVDSGSGGTVGALTSLSTNYEVPNLTGSATIANGTAAKANTIRYTGSGDTITIGSGSSLDANGIMNAGTGTLTISASDSTGAVVVTSNNYNANSRYYMIFDAANADINVLAPVDNLYSKGADISATSDGTHNVMFNAVQSTGTGGVSFQEPIVIGTTKNLSVTPTNGTIGLTAVGDYTPNGGAAQTSTVTLNTGAAISLSGGSTYSGGTILNGAYVALPGGTTAGDFGAAGSTVTINTGSTIENSSTGGASISTSYNYTVNGDFTFGHAGDHGLTLTGPWTLNKTVTVTTVNVSGSYTLGAVGETSGNDYGLTAVGYGTLTLGGINSFTGPLAVGGANINGESTFTPGYSPTVSATAGNTLTLPSVAGLVAGQLVADVTTSGNIPTGTYISSISGNTVTLNNSVLAFTNNVVAFGVVNGVVSLSGASPGWNSKVVLNPSGELSLGAGSLGNGTLTINGGVLTGNATVGGTPTYVLAGNFTMGTNTTNNTLNLSSGNVTLAPATGNAVTITLNSKGYTDTLGAISDGGNGYGLTLNMVPGTSGGFALSGPVNIGGPLTVSGGVTATLSNADNLYTGNTVITGGTLKLTPATGINNNIAFSPKIIVGDSLADNAAVLDVSAVAGVSSSGFHVVSGQTLAGYGSVNGKITVDTGGHLAPGNSIGTLTVNNFVTLNGSSDFEINDDTTTSDLLTGATKLVYGGTLNVTDLGDTTGYNVGQTFTLFTLGAAGTESGTFANVNLPTLPSGLAWSSFNYATGQITVQAGSPVPEPASLMLLGLGGLALLVRGRRRRV